jgi:hypothetical protein
MKRRLFVTVAIGLACPSLAWAGQAEVFTGLVTGVAVGGYDAVSYFKDGQPRLGKADLAFQWKDAAWRFANEDNLKAFTADPEKYAPQYGGYCAFAVSKGATAKGDPAAWTIVGGKLFLNYSTAVREKWRSDIPGNISSADANWPSVLN